MTVSNIIKELNAAIASSDINDDTRLDLIKSAISSPFYCWIENYEYWLIKLAQINEYQAKRVIELYESKNADVPQELILLTFKYTLENILSKYKEIVTSKLDLSSTDSLIISNLMEDFVDEVMRKHEAK